MSPHGESKDINAADLKDEPKVLLITAKPKSTPVETSTFIQEFAFVSNIGDALQFC